MSERYDRSRPVSKRQREHARPLFALALLTSDRGDSLRQGQVGGESLSSLSMVRTEPAFVGRVADESPLGLALVPSRGGLVADAGNESAVRRSEPCVANFADGRLHG